MNESRPEIQHIAVAAHPNLPGAIDQAEIISNYLIDHGIQAVHGMLFDEQMCQRIDSRDFDMLIALGGDGTMLRAGHLCGPARIPILGVNMGRFGFLMEIRLDQWQEIMPRVLKGDYWLEKRMMLCAIQNHEDEAVAEWEVLNEVVVGRGETVRPVHLVTNVDGRFLTTYVADGLIAATPTGSTAYALAAGGPILPPELRNILLVPIAPHLSIDRAIVLAEGSSVKITVKTEHQAVLSVDGQPPVKLTSGDYVDIRTSEHTVKFVRFQDPGYFYRNLTPHMYLNPSTGNQR